MRPTIPFVVRTLGMVDSVTLVQVMGDCVRFAVVDIEAVATLRMLWSRGIYDDRVRVLVFPSTVAAPKPPRMPARAAGTRHNIWSQAKRAMAIERRRERQQ